MSLPDANIHQRIIKDKARKLWDSWRITVGAMQFPDEAYSAQDTEEVAVLGRLFLTHGGFRS